MRLRLQLENTLKSLSDKEFKDDLEMLNMFAANFIATSTEAEILGIKTLSETMCDLFQMRESYIKVKLSDIKTQEASDGEVVEP